MFTQYGHKVFSLGTFHDPNKPANHLRQGRPEFYNEELLERFVALDGHNDLRRVPLNFSRYFDVVIVNHFPEWVRFNLEAFGDTPVILRSIGQSSSAIERDYNALGDRVKIIRYSNTEVNKPGFAKTHGVIYFSKFKEDYEIWSGGDAGLTFQNDFCSRTEYATPNLQEWRTIHDASNCRLFGRNNEDVGESSGLAPAEDMSNLLRRAAFYLYVYTRPPSYHLSVMEALMAGTPVLAPSAKLIASKASMADKWDDGYTDAWTEDRYEVPSFLAEGAGLTYDTAEEGASLAKMLHEKPDLAAGYSARGRQRAIEKFDAATIITQWNDLFEKICASVSANV
ncbi:glycosyltransferase [Methylobacterium sp. WL6]|uniref:glycosyltransferase n=1 Tax=Methylobacterium sp. WL6 TaxID=2603901 RepID=UPI0011C7712E|nr:glycosyltransferase [Methylobacterium sp. WL6]TXN60959.1 glycosyltransferase [Methylobacterium sp. WL6]